VDSSDGHADAACALQAARGIARGMKIAIIGAGMAGLACGENLVRAGHQVSMFDKGRGPGGRMATRRMEIGDQTLRFDHGAQYFTARDPRFSARVGHWEEAGMVARWPNASPEAWVGTPGMNAPIRAMAQALPVQFGMRVEGISSTQAGWHLAGEGLSERADAVVVAVPAEQAATLLLPHHADFAGQAAEIVSEPCWTLMLAFDRPLTETPNTLRSEGAIGWAACNSAKPGRIASGSGGEAGEESGAECWVVQGSPAWSRKHLELDKGDAQALLFAEFAQLAGPLPKLLASACHRWRYAQVPRRDGAVLWDAQAKLGACGDWVKGPRVENAFLSGLELADAIGPATDPATDPA